jgi:hypothetical protein
MTDPNAIRTTKPHRSDDLDAQARYERIKAYQQRYREEHRAEARERSRRWYQANKDYAAEQQRRHADRANACSRRYYARNREAILAEQRRQREHDKLAEFAKDYA